MKKIVLVLCLFLTLALSTNTCNASAKSNTNTNNIHSREASTAHGVVSSSSYSELTGNRKYVGIVNRLANVSPVEVALCFIPYVGEKFCTLLPHASYRQYQTEYKYSVTVNYYNEMGYFMYSRTYNGYSYGTSYERIS